jgi:chaperone required for assembly of F1-ATPase
LKDDAAKLARRFYKETQAVGAEGGHGVLLDGRTLRTPGGVAFIASTRAVAELCAAEWAAQGEHIVPASMPVSQFAFAAIDWTAKSRSDIAKYVASFGQTDLCCHRAAAPADLAAHQAKHWDPLVRWGADELGVRLPVVEGIIAADVDGAELAKLEAHANALDDFRLTALGQATGLAGSALIAFALLRGQLSPQQAFEAAALDNLWSLEKWGEDAEARSRLERQRGEFEGLGRFIAALDA